MAVAMRVVGKGQKRLRERRTTTVGVARGEGRINENWGSKRTRGPEGKNGWIQRGTTDRFFSLEAERRKKSLRELFDVLLNGSAMLMKR